MNVKPADTAKPYSSLPTLLPARIRQHTPGSQRRYRSQRLYQRYLRSGVFVLLALTAFASLAIEGAASSGSPLVEKSKDGITVAVGGSFLRIEIVADNVVRVAYAKDKAFFDHQSLAIEPRSGGASFHVTTGPHETTVSTARLSVRVNTRTGAVAFFDTAGRPILMEKTGGKTLTAANVQGEQTFHVRQEWVANQDESLYGLGQQHLGLMDIKNYDIDLWQHNGTVVVPFLVSSRGYGILWDNPSYTRFGDLGEFEAIPANRLFDVDGNPGGLSGSYYTGLSFDKLVATRTDPVIDIQVPGGIKGPNTSIHPDLPPEGNISVRWEGEVQAPTTGDYQFKTFSNNGVKVWVDGRQIIDHWRQGWLPWIDLARVKMEAGRRYRIKVEWTKDQGMETMRLLWKPPVPGRDTSLWSEVGKGIDYYFVYGPDLDKVVAGYRSVTGKAPMMPLWAFGLWQSRQRYNTQQESLDVLEGFRSRGIPIDNIVQDWFYWKEAAWGSHEFDPARFPDPEGWIRSIHDKYHARLMISVWPKFYEGTKNFEEMHSRGYLYEPNLREGIHDWVGHIDTFYDAFNPGARKLFWSQVERELFTKKVDGWWLDASEPDLTPTPTLEGQRSHVNPTALGTGASVLNAYSLYNSEAVYDGQRAAAPDQRVFILTRSGFTGQQRYAAATWSGDTSSTWAAMREQIPAGLGFSMSGIPYWTMDVGGFSVPARFSTQNPKPEDVDEWRELNTRWFQFGAFCPLLRPHGEYPYREMWYLGGESSQAYKTELKFDRLRYRLLPYIYSLAGDVTERDGTMMRPLVMDFRFDPKAREIPDQYMFGPALLVNPVTTYKARSRPVYLPRAAGWYDFWTGGWHAGGQTLDAPAPYDSMPLYVKAGSIVPFGPELQYTAEKPADPITLLVYAGANGSFALYEDQGLTYDYEKGAFTIIPIHWNDASRTLTIGKRNGSFPGMLTARTFNVVLISKAKPAGFSFTPPAGRTVRYSGAAVQVHLR
ncbi:MAG TPA: TIM-barrel domain-containing protein [Blastocatellia bacterium]|nr:TIM-barrel domain-containing protein [Blastocatellia bacterium]